MAQYPYIRPGQSSQHISHSEFEILRASHRFLRDEDDGQKPHSWNEQLAAKYYDSLYREFALCDLRHYKTGNFALRWRTENEVLSGAGETSCGNTRCEHRTAPEGSGPPLTTLELPFAYEEHGQVKSALVKVVLCPKCVKKLMWKRRKEKESQKESADRPKGDQDAGTVRKVGNADDEESRLGGDEKVPTLGKKRRQKDDGDEVANDRERDEHKKSRRDSHSKSPAREREKRRRAK